MHQLNNVLVLLLFGTNYKESIKINFFKLGEYLGLTATRLDAAEMVACGLATHFVSSKVQILLEVHKKLINQQANLAQVFFCSGHRY